MSTVSDKGSKSPASMPDHMIRHATLRQLQIFEATVRLGSFTRAAEELGFPAPGAGALDTEEALVAYAEKARLTRHSEELAAAWSRASLGPRKPLALAAGLVVLLLVLVLGCSQ